MKVVAGFHTRNDEWILPLKLATLSQFCDSIVVCVDRGSAETWATLRAWPKVQAFEHKNTLGFPDNDPERGPLCEEGAMRQEVWEACAKLKPDYIILGDTDEILTPDIVPFLATVKDKHFDIDYFLLPIINLYKGEDRYISGKTCVWSPSHSQANRRAAIIRFVGGRDYVPYPVQKPCHVRLEPSFRPREGEPISAKLFVLLAPRVLHYKFANWPRWLASYKAGMQKYQDYWRGLELSPVPREWIWDAPLPRR